MEMRNKHGIRIIEKGEKVFGTNLECIPGKDFMPRRKNDGLHRYPILKEALERAGK